jgi:hypothetical protein
LCALSALSVAAEDEITVENQSSYFGIYVGGEKVGFSSWTIERKEGARVWYKLTMSEERRRMVKDKEVKDLFTYAENLSPSLEPEKLDYEENRAGKKTIIKAKVSEGVAEMEVQFAGQKPMPAQKIKITPLTQFAFSAGLIFAWKLHPKDGKAVFSRLLEMNRTVLNSDLTAEDLKYKFEGEEVDAVSWADAEKKVVLVTDGNGKLLQHTEVSANGTETKYIREGEELAKSNMTWEQKAEKDKAKPKTGKPGQKKAGAAVEKFEDALDPVDEDAEVSMGGEYFKLNVQEEDAKFSIRAAKGWMCGTAKQGETTIYAIVELQAQDHPIRIIPDRGNEEDADVQVEALVKELEENGGWTNVDYEEEVESFELGDKECAGALVSSIVNNTKMMAYICIIPGEKVRFILLAIAVEDDFEDYAKDYYAMIGSARYE